MHKGVSIVDREAYDDYRKSSDIRNPKNVSYYTDYRKIARKIWKKIAEDSVNHESGVYVKDFFYLVPHVVDNKPFLELPNGKIKTNYHTNGNIYAPLFCNLFKNLGHYSWTIDGCFVESYSERLNDVINRLVPKYFFILPTLIKNKL